MRLLNLLTMMAIVILGLTAAPDASAEQVRFDGHRVVRVTVETPAELDQLLGMTDDVWTDAPRPGLVDVRVDAEQYERLRASGLEFSVMIEDLQALIEGNAAANDRGRGTFDQYLPMDDVLAYLDTLVALRPDLAETFVAGQTIEGRDIVGIHITGPGTEPKPGIFFHGAQHAREWITVPVVLYIADTLIREYDTDPFIQSLVDGREWFLIPVVNVDGYIYTWTTNRMWRKNRRLNTGGCYGVDLNRNWGYGWGGPGSSDDPCSETYRGEAPFSEPEIQAMRDWIIDHPNIVAYVDLHSYSQVIFFPTAMATYGPPSRILATIGTWPRRWRTWSTMSTARRTRMAAAGTWSTRSAARHATGSMDSPDASLLATNCAILAPTASNCRPSRSSRSARKSSRRCCSTPTTWVRRRNCSRPTAARA